MSNAPAHQHCTQCNVDRRIAGVMGGNYYTLATCGHVIPKGR